MSQPPAFPPNVISSRPRVALSCFTIMLGDIMRNLRVDRAPRSIASPRPVQVAGASTAEPGAISKAAATAGESGSVVSAPTYSLLPESTESIIRSMGVDVGMRSVAHISDIAILPGVGGAATAGGGTAAGTERTRPATFVDAARFIASHCWEYWFDHPPAQKFQHLEAFYIDEYENMSCFPFSGPDGAGAVNGVAFNTFVQGMVEGAMRACGYPVVVNFSSADAEGLQQWQILPLKLPALS
jgi:hypothetical protein